MTNTTNATRRAFLKGGALAAAPLAAAGSAMAGTAGDDLQARLARLEDEKAIRAVRAAWMRHVNAGAREEAAALYADPKHAQFDDQVRAITAAEADNAETIEINGSRATLRLACTAALEAPVEPWCPMVDMAREQGEGVVRRAEPRVLEAALVKRDGAWALEQLELTSV